MNLTIPIILGSTRRDRQSPKAAAFVEKQLNAREGVTAKIIDLAALELPMLEERLHRRDDPPQAVVDFGAMVAEGDAIVIVSPEYNYGYPGVLKNALDYLGPEYRRKPFGLVTVSSGPWGGQTCLAQLRLVTLGLGGFPIPASLPVNFVRDGFDDDGAPVDEESWNRRAKRFVDELLWYAEAIVEKKRRETAA